MNESLAFLTKYCDFSDPNWIWILTGISRAKDNPQSYHDYLMRLVLTKPEDILECYERIHKETTQWNTVYRMYVSLNARDVVKTLFSFQRKLSEIGYGLSRGQNDALQLSKSVGSLWKTELAQNGNRATKRILFDIDTLDPEKIGLVISYLTALAATIRAWRSTPSGCHIVIDACDTRGFMDFCKEKDVPIDLQRDSMVFVEKWNGAD